MAANHTAMFEVLYQVRQLISLTHKICQGRNMPSHTKMHMLTPKSAVCTDVGQNTDTMTMIRARMAWWWGALCLLIEKQAPLIKAQACFVTQTRHILSAKLQQHINALISSDCSVVPRDSLTAISLSSRALWLIVIWKRRCIRGKRLLLD